MPPAGGGPPARSMLNTMRRPIGSSFGKCICANRVLMMALSWPGEPSSGREHASALERQADGLEVLRIHGEHRHRRRLFAGGERPPIHREPSPEAALHGRVARHADRPELRVRAQPLLQPLVEGQAFLERRIFALRQHQRHRQQVRGLDAEIQAIHREEVAHHEAGAGEQRQRQRELGDDRALLTSGARACRPIPSARPP